MSGTEELERVNINIPPGASLPVSKSEYWRLSVCLKAESGESCGAYQAGDAVTACHLQLQLLGN